MGPDGGFITGSDFLMDGGVTAAYWYGELAEMSANQSPQENRSFDPGARLGQAQPSSEVRGS